MISSSHSGKGNPEDAFELTFSFNVTEFYTDQDIDDMIRATEKVASYYRGEKR